MVQVLGGGEVRFYAKDDVVLFSTREQARKKRKEIIL